MTTSQRSSSGTASFPPPSTDIFVPTSDVEPPTKSIECLLRSKPEVSALPSQVCSTLKSGHRPAGPACPHRAIRNRLNKTPVKSLAWKQPEQLWR